MTLYIKNNKITLLIVISALLLGIITGAANADGLSSEKSSEIYSLTNSCIRENSLYSAFTKSLCIQFTRFVILYICGITVIGSPVAVFYTGYLGFSLGFSSAFLFKYYGFCGILSIIGGIFPHYIILIPSYLLAAAMSINFSNGLLLKNNCMRDNFKIYSIKMLIIGFLIFVSCIIEGFISSFFLKIITGLLK